MKPLSLFPESEHKENSEERIERAEEKLKRAERKHRRAEEEYCIETIRKAYREAHSEREEV